MDNGQNFSYKKVDRNGAGTTVLAKLEHPEDFLWLRKGKLNDSFFYNL